MGRIKFFIVGLLAPVLALAANVTSIDFVNSDKASEIDIHSDGPVVFEKSENPNDKQIVIDLKGSSLAAPASRKMDTSSFDSKVVLVSPYQVNNGADSRVVVQLRDMASATVTQNGNVIAISIPNKGGSDSASSGPPAPTTGNDLPPPAATADTSAAPSTSTPQAAQAPTPPAPESVASPTAADSASVAGSKDKLDQFIEERETGRFVGKPITLKVRDADVMDVFRLISETSGFNIIVGDDVKGKLTLSLEDVPWDQALDVILRTEKLGAERNNNVLRIVTLADLTAEKRAEIAAKQAAEAAAPRITRIFPINYAKLEDLVTVLTKLGAQNPPSISGGGGLAAGAAAAAAASALSNAPIVQIDPRTNSIIVRDTVENVERMHKLIQILDTQTPQVLIEGKVIEASDQFSKAISGSLGVGQGNSTNQYFGSVNGANPIDPLFSVNNNSPTGNSVFTNGNATSTATSGGGSFGLSPTLAFLPGNARLNALLNLSESDNTIKIVSSPKAVVMDKESASIVQSTPVLTLTIAQTANGPVSLPTIQQANLSLNVTPTVTNEGSVLMQLSLSKDIAQSLGTVNGQASSAVANRNITTKVLVESGSTLVMGGIYTLDETNSESGFPVLRKIPILGALFGSDSKTTEREELFFFITPRILNLKESGIAG